MSAISYLLLSAAVLDMVWCGNAWFYQSATSSPTSNHLLSKNQFLLPPYPSYQHELLHHPPSSQHHLTFHDNRYYGSPGEFAEPTSYNELSFEGPYEVTAPRVPGLYFRLSSGVFVPVKAVYSFPPYLERIIQRIQGYYSVYNPPDALGLERPIPGGGIPLPSTGVPLPPTLEVHPVLPPHPPANGPVPKPEDGSFPSSSPEPTSESPEDSKPDEPTTPEQPETRLGSTTTTTTESTREETTAAGDMSSATENLDSTTDSSSEQTTAI